MANASLIELISPNSTASPHPLPLSVNATRLSSLHDLRNDMQILEWVRNPILSIHPPGDTARRLHLHAARAHRHSPQHLRAHTSHDARVFRSSAHLSSDNRKLQLPLFTLIDSGAIQDRLWSAISGDVAGGSHLVVVDHSRRHELRLLPRLPPVDFAIRALQGTSHPPFLLPLPVDALHRAHDDRLQHLVLAVRVRPSLHGSLPPALAHQSLASRSTLSHHHAPSRDRAQHLVVIRGRAISLNLRGIALKHVPRYQSVSHAMHSPMSDHACQIAARDGYLLFVHCARVDYIRARSSRHSQSSTRSRVNHSHT